MKLLQLLSILGSDDQTMSKEIYKTLQDTLASSECTSNIGLGKNFTIRVLQPTENNYSTQKPRRQNIREEKTFAVL